MGTLFAAKRSQMAAKTCYPAAGFLNIVTMVDE